MDWCGCIFGFMVVLWQWRFRVGLPPKNADFPITNCWFTRGYLEVQQYLVGGLEHSLLFHIWEIFIIPIDSPIFFQRGRRKKHQPDMEKSMVHRSCMWCIAGQGWLSVEHVGEFSPISWDIGAPNRLLVMHPRDWGKGMGYLVTWLWQIRDSYPFLLLSLSLSL